MKAKELQELLDFIAKSGLNKVNIETEEFKISVQRDPNTKHVTTIAAPVAHAQVVTLTSGFVRITSEGIQPGGLIVWWPQ